jgi:hypothetical protein
MNEDTLQEEKQEFIQAEKEYKDILYNRSEKLSMDRFKREINFFPSYTHPKYANQSDYILLVKVKEKDAEDFDEFDELCEGDEEMLIAQWIDNSWWVTTDSYEQGERKIGSHNEPLQPVLFEKFDDHYFEILGWFPLFNGSLPC